MAPRSWKGWVPAPLKRVARAALRVEQFRRAMARLADLRPGDAPGRGLLAALRSGWGNEGFTADLYYLEEVARRAATTAGPVLECGSGLTTLVLGILAGRRGVETWSLEQDPVWFAPVAKALRRYRVFGVRLRLAPLRDYGDFLWYDPPFAEMPATFGLVVCDGPPGSTRGGRFGLMPVCGHRFSPDTVILLDDAARDNEFRTLCRWARQADLQVELRELPEGTLALISGCR